MNTHKKSPEDLDQGSSSEKYEQLLKGVLDPEKIQATVQFILENPVISKRELAQHIKGTRTEVDTIINHLKKGGVGKDFILIKPKSLTEADDAMVKFYYNIDAAENIKEPEDFFIQANDTYRNYFLQKIQEFSEENTDEFENRTDFIKTLSGIIEYPRDFTAMMLDYLEKYNFIDTKNNGLSITKKGEDLLPVLKACHFEDRYVSLEENKNLTNYILQNILKNPEKEQKAIQKELLKTFGFTAGLKEIKLFREEGLKKMKEGKTENLYNLSLGMIKLRKKYKIENGAYIFTIKKENHEGEKIEEDVPISVADIDKLFFLYSARGANLTQKQVIEVTNINESLWGTLKSRLSLTKHSDIAGPYTIELFGKDDHTREDYVQKVWSDYQKIKLRAEETTQKRREVQKMQHKLEKIFSTQEAFKSHFSDVLSKRKPKKAQKLREGILPPTKNKEFTISFSDIHFGKVGHEQIVKRLEKIVANLGNSDAEKVNIFCLGDLAEALVEGGMHTGQKEKMDWSGKDTYEMMMDITALLENFLIEIYKTGKEVHFYGIGGNHDRLGKNHDQDMSRTGALIIYELVKRGLLHYSEADTIVVEYGRNKWNTQNRDDFHYILHHGDDGATTKGLTSPEKILWQMGKREKHNIILMGDKHHMTMKNPVENATFLQVPALAGKGEYDSRLLLSSHAGYATIEKGQDEMPEISIKYLQ